MTALSRFVRRVFPASSTTATTRPAARPQLGVEALELRENPSAGYFDTSFGQGGTTRVDVRGSDWFPAKPAAVAVQADGKILLAGTVYNGWHSGDDFAVVRLNANGSLDTTFGVGGRAIYGFDLGYGADEETGDPARYVKDEAKDIAIDPQGRIVVAGTVTEGDVLTSTAAGVLRLTANGQLDTTFGKGGRAVIEVPTAYGYGMENSANAVAIDKADGSVMIAGTACPNPYVPSGGISSYMSVARLKPNGKIDSSFGTGGVKVIDFGTGGYGRMNRANDVAIDPQGRIVLAGAASADIVGNTDFAAVRLTRTGAFDPSFHGTGRTTVAIDYQYRGRDEAVAVAIDPQGRIVLGGTGEVNRPLAAYSAVARLRSDGYLDTSFGGDGTTGDTSRPFGTADMVVDSQSRVYLVGMSGSGAIETVRLNASGYYDSSFGVGGKSSAGFAGVEVKSVGGLALDAYDRVVTVAAVSPHDFFSSYEFGVARLRSDVSLFLAPGVGNGGPITISSPSSVPAAIVTYPTTSIFAPSGTSSSTISLSTPISSSAPAAIVSYPPSTLTVVSSTPMTNVLNSSSLSAARSYLLR